MGSEQSGDRTDRAPSEMSNRELRARIDVLQKQQYHIQGMIDALKDELSERVDGDDDPEVATDGGDRTGLEALSDLRDRGMIDNADTDCTYCGEETGDCRPCPVEAREYVPRLCDECYVAIRDAGRLDKERDRLLFSPDIATDGGSERDADTVGRVHCVWKVPDDYETDAESFHDIGIYPSGELMGVCSTDEKAQELVDRLKSRSPSDRFGDSMEDAPYAFSISTEEVNPLAQ